jgi:hypothetical protein
MWKLGTLFKDVVSTREKNVSEMHVASIQKMLLPAKSGIKPHNRNGEENMMKPIS